MKKTVVLMAFGMSLSCAAFSQDSVRKMAPGQSKTMKHKKPMHHMQSQSNSMSVDSVNGGQITTSTNPHGQKMSTAPRSGKKAGKNMTPSGTRNSVDSSR